MFRLGLLASPLLCAMLAAGPAAELTVLAAAGAPAPGSGAVNDRWMAEVAGAELERFAASGELAVLATRVRSAMLARLACGRFDDFSALTELVYVYRACGYLLLAEEMSDGKAFARWLLEHKAVSRRLFRALEDVPEPAPALEALRQLVAAEEKAVLAYPDLAVAFATSRPMKHYRPQPAACTMLEGFRWYTNPAIRFRYDLKKMPYELARYLADTRLSLAERKWAFGKYKATRNPARAYFDLKYDWKHYREGVPKKIAKLPYTLANLKRVGGVCIDQAYYAAEVCKALGVPAAIVIGRGRTGMGHAWVACLRLTGDGRRGRWDSTTGRYEAHRYYSGQLRDPASGRLILDSELQLICSAAQLPLRRREEADAAVVLARMVDRLRDRQPAVGLEVLKGWAELYEKRHRGADGARAEVGWLSARRKIDLGLVEELIEMAVRRNVACKPAWELLIELRKANRLPVGDLDRFFDILIDRTARAFPDYSCTLVMRIVPTIPEFAKRLRVYRRALGIYGSRPDLYGRILIAIGDDYAKEGLADKALRAYEQAAARCVQVAEVVLTASGRAEKLLRDAGRTRLAINMYKRLFAKARRLKTAFREQTAYYQLGRRLARLLREAGQDDAAERIEKKL